MAGGSAVDRFAVAPCVDGSRLSSNQDFHFRVVFLSLIELSPL
jgi:hypothetical protein